MKKGLVLLTAMVATALWAVSAHAESKPASQIVAPSYGHLPARGLEYQRHGRKRVTILPPMLIQKIDVLDDTRMSSGEIAIPDVPRPSFKKYPQREHGSGELSADR